MFRGYYRASVRVMTKDNERNTSDKMFMSFLFVQTTGLNEIFIDVH